MPERVKRSEKLMTVPPGTTPNVRRKYALVVGAPTLRSVRVAV